MGLIKSHLNIINSIDLRRKMEKKQSVQSSAYPDGTFVKYLFGMKKPEINYSVDNKDVKKVIDNKMKKRNEQV